MRTVSGRAFFNVYRKDRNVVYNLEELEKKIGYIFRIKSS